MQNDGHPLTGHFRTVAVLAHQGLGRMRQRFQARQAKEPAGALHRMHQTENIGQDCLIVGFLLELDQFDVHNIKALKGFGQKLAKKIVHATPPRIWQDGGRTTDTRLLECECWLETLKTSEIACTWLN